MRGGRLMSSPPSTFGEPLACGRIVRFRHPHTDFDEACAAGEAHAMEHFSEMMAGLRVGHADALRQLGFFARVADRIGVNVDVGSWEEVASKDLRALDQII